MKSMELLILLIYLLINNKTEINGNLKKKYVNEFCCILYLVCVCIWRYLNDKKY